MSAGLRFRGLGLGEGDCLHVESNEDVGVAARRYPRSSSLETNPKTRLHLHVSFHNVCK